MNKGVPIDPMKFKPETLTRNKCRYCLGVPTKMRKIKKRAWILVCDEHAKPGAKSPPLKAKRRADQKRKKRVEWNPEWNVLLGTKPDMEVARETSTSLQTVQLHRRYLKIPSFRLSYQEKGSRIEVALTALPEEMLRTQTAAQLAEGIGCSAASINKYRQARSIKPKHPSRLRWRGRIDPNAVRRAMVGGALAAFSEHHGDGLYVTIGAILDVTRERASQLCAEVRAAIMAAPPADVPKPMPDGPATPLRFAEAVERLIDAANNDPYLPPASELVDRIYALASAVRVEKGPK